MSLTAFVLAAVLSSAAAPEPVHLGDEVSLSILRIGNAVQFHPRYTTLVVPGDDSYLVLWSEVRGDYPAFSNLYSVNGAAMRVSTTGQLLDVISTPLPLQPQAAVWNGSQWIVFGQYGYVRISRNGTLLDSSMRSFPKQLDTPNKLLAVSTGAAVILVVQSGYDRFGRLYAATFDADMNPLGEYSLLEVADRGGIALSIASDGDSALVLYRDGIVASKPYYSAMFSRNGVLESRRSISASAYYGHVATAAVDGGYLVVARDETTSSKYVGYRIDRNNDRGTTYGPFGPASTPFHLTASPLLHSNGSSATFYPVVEYPIPATLFAKRFTAAGDFQDETTLMPWIHESYEVIDEPLISWLKGTTLLAQIVNPTHTVDGHRALEVRVTASESALASTPPKNVVMNILPQELPAAAASATQSLIAWRERVNDFEPLTLFAARVTDGGTVLDPQSILIAKDTCNGQAPVVASDGRDFLVAWRDSGALRTARVSASGAIGEQTKLYEGTGCWDPHTAIASNGSGYFVTWMEHLPTGWGILASRFSSDGKRIDASPLVLGLGVDANFFPAVFPVVAGNGRDFLVVWGSQATRVPADATQLDSLTRTSLGTGVAEGMWWNGTSYVVWMRDASAKYRLQRVGSDGVPGASSTTTMPANIQAKQRIFVCRAQSCSTPFENSLLRVDDDGQKLAVQTSLVNLVGSYSSSTVLAGVSKAFLVYVRSAPERPYGDVSRVFFRPILPPVVRSRSVRH